MVCSGGVPLRDAGAAASVPVRRKPPSNPNTAAAAAPPAAAASSSTTTTTTSAPALAQPLGRVLDVERVELGREDKVGAREAADRVRAEHDLHVAVVCQVEVRVVLLGFCHAAHGVEKGDRFCCLFF
jgi:hypothetical protein